MAKKKEPTVDDALKSFKDIMNRAELSKFIYVNNKMISQNKAGKSILIIVNQILWSKLIDDPEFKANIKELDLSKESESKLQPLFKYGDELEDGWINVDTDIIYKGDIFEVKINGFDYKLPIHRNLIPLKLRKAEYNNIKYKVFLNPNTLGIKKKFEFPIKEKDTDIINDYGFTIMRLLKII